MQKKHTGTQAKGSGQMSCCRAAEFLAAVYQPEACDTHSCHSNHTSIDWIQWKAKWKAEEWSLRALRGLQCQDNMHNLGQWEKEVWKPRCLHGNHSVDTAITSSSQQIHSDKKVTFALYAGRNNKINSVWLIHSHCLPAARALHSIFFS